MLGAWILSLCVSLATVANFARLLYTPTHATYHQPNALGVPLALWRTRYATYAAPPNLAQRWWVRFGAPNPNATAETQALLDAVDVCVRSVTVLAPTLRGSTIAAVFGVRVLRLKAPWIATSEHFWSSVPVFQLYVLVHECTHLALDCDDFAYFTDAHYARLPPEHAVRNADTVAAYLLSVA